MEAIKRNKNNPDRIPLEKIRDNIPIYLLGLIAITWPLGMLFMSIGKTCFMTQTFYSPYGVKTYSEIIPEMVIILSFLTALVIFAQLMLLFRIKKKVNTNASK